MSKSLFKKLFILYIGIILASFGILGFVLSGIFETYFVYQKERQLIVQGEKISKQYQLAYFTGIVDRERLNFELEVLDRYLNARIWFVDHNGRVYIESSSMQKSWVGQQLSQEDVQKVLQGNRISIKGRFGGMFAEPVLTVGYPIMINNRVLGGLFMHSSIPEIQKTVSEVYRITLFCLFLSTLLAFVLIFLASRRITKPLMQMNNAAKVIAGGDFHKRLDIKSKDEIGQLAESFNNMAEDLSKLEEVRKSFIANISHDLRSPLTSIQGFVQAILDGTIPYERQEKYLHIVLDETHRLTKLTNDIMELTKMENGEIALQKTNFEINEIIRRVLLQFEARVIEKQLQIEVLFAQEHTMVYADEEKIKRILYNLMDNGIKFTPEQQKIVVETTLQDAKVLVSIKDSGIGIHEEDQKYIFDRFYKADNSRGRDKKGTGLGLAIVKEIIKSHGEIITVKSEVEKGTEFTFSLPIGKEEKEADI